MKKRFLTRLVMALLISGIFSACSKEQKVNVSVPDDIAQQLKFVPVNDLIKEKFSPNSRDRIIIVRWSKWGRASRDCHGFGICDAEWFPQSYTLVINPTPGNGGAAILEFDNIMKQYYFDINLASPPPATIPLSNLNLAIDYDITFNTRPETPTDLKIKTGMYYYNNTIGNYGGFRIFLVNV